MNREKLFTIRAKNLQQLLELRFKGDSRAFANKIDSKPLTLSKYLNPISDRPCKDKAARRIENKLNLASGFLDCIDHSSKDIYYIGLYTNARYTFETIKALQNDGSIVECSCVLGDFDIFIKVEIENYRYLDMLLARIAKMPGVKRTQTLSSVKSLHWQREQQEDMELQAKNEALYIDNGIEAFISRKMNFYFNQIKALEKGDIHAKDGDHLSLKPEQIIKGAKKNLFFTLTPKQYSASPVQLEIERLLIMQGVQSQRIIFLCAAYDEYWIEIATLYKQFSDIGSDVRFLFLNSWTETPSSNLFESYTIIDQRFVCIRREALKQFLIRRDEHIVDAYLEIFYDHWDNAYTVETIKEMMNRP